MIIYTTGATGAHIAPTSMPPAARFQDSSAGFEQVLGSSGGSSPTPVETARSPSRTEDSRPDPTTPFEAKSGSVRSILRDRGTPGTGQSVGFFSRDAYKVLSPDQSEYQSVMTQAIVASAPPPKEESFLDRLQRGGSMDSNVSASLPRFASTNKLDTSGSQLLSQLPPLPAPDFADYTNNNFFDMDMSQDLELQLPVLPPPGLGFDMDVSLNGIGTETEGEGGLDAMTPPPYRDKGKGREVEAKENLAPNGIDETILKVPRLPSALQHERSNSFSAGQAMFYSMAQEDSKRSSTSTGDFPSSAKASPMSGKDSPASRHSSPGLSLKHRGRALSETVFMSMLRSPSSHVSQEMEMIGNISIPFINEGELRKMAAEKEQRTVEEKERERQREAEFGWEDEREDLAAPSRTQSWRKWLLKDSEEELGMIKSELEARWDHTENNYDVLVVPVPSRVNAAGAHLRVYITLKCHSQQGVLEKQRDPTSVVRVWAKVLYIDELLKAMADQGKWSKEALGKLMQRSQRIKGQLKDNPSGVSQQGVNPREH
ncbi:hypothetical protein C8F04DRAFT_1184285 [Mycena alexandri]|uniref:Uncharacterized protein n=1 Tax=Mycena alexandri TaxID=1745969 RepID=A0AAD6SSL0_9AGAR|nr:hypothetical protein C8F04DRAFT_1184285 [Mycena alexandri]